MTANHRHFRAPPSVLSERASKDLFSTQGTVNQHKRAVFQMVLGGDLGEVMHQSDVCMYVHGKAHL